jgi:hypothetical protein
VPETIGYERNGKISKRLSKSMDEKLKSAYDRLTLGQNYRATMRESEWRNAYRQYMGTDQWRYSPDDKTADLVNINMSFSTINTLVPFVADENPKFLITPESGDATSDHATILESFMNRLWQSKDVQGQIYVSEATFDYLLYGDGYMKVNYEMKGKPTYDARGNLVEEDRTVVAHFTVSRPSPWDVWIDPYSDGLHNARWVCQRIVLPAEELKNDDRYKTVHDIEGDDIDENNMASEDSSRLDETEGYTTIFEFYDLRENWMMTFTSGGSQAIRYIEHVVCPLVQLHNYRIPNSPYHMSELEQVASLQNELNKTRSQMMTHRRRNVMKWMVRDRAVDEDGMQAMKSSIVNDVIPVMGNEPFNELIAPVQSSPLSGDAYQMEAQIRADINEITGVNEYLRGMPQGNSRTATEATILEGATNIRTRHKLLQIETAAKQVGQLLLDIIQDVLPLTDFNEMSMYVTGREAEKLNRATGQEDMQADAVLTPIPEIFEGRYIVEVERGSTELRNPQIKSQKLREMVTLMMSATPILMQMQIPFNIKRLLELWFEAEGIEDVDALFEIDEGQEMAQQMALMQQAQAAAGGGGSASGGEGANAGRTPPGAPRAETSKPPTDMINEQNSGTLGARY